MRLKFAVTVLVFCVAGLLSLGLVMLYSSTMADKGSRLVQIQLIWSGLGLLLGVSASWRSIDLEHERAASSPRANPASWRFRGR